MNTMFPANGIIINGELYSLVENPYDSCQGCELCEPCWREWQGYDMRPCNYFGVENVMFVKASIPIGENSIFTFGKFKGKTISEVIDSDPRYVAWVVKNVKWFNLDDELKDKLRNKLQESINRRSCMRHNYPFTEWSEDGEIAGQDAFGSIY